MTETRGPAAYDYVRAQLLDAMAGGRLLPGHSLKVSATARRLGVSRTPVYRALGALVTEGRLAALGTGGYLVLNPDGSRPAFLGLPDDWAEPAHTQASSRPSAEPLWRGLFQHVRHEIAAVAPFGRFLIAEAELARAHAVSRTVARDLLARLQQLGMVQKDPRGRWSATALTDRRIAELYELRAQLEPLALRQANRYLHPDELAQEEASLEESLAGYPAISGRQLDAHEDRLHVGLLERATNRELVALLRQTRLPLVSNHALFEERLGIKPEIEMLEEHHQILRLLRSGAPEAAAEALGRHVARSCIAYSARMAAFRAQGEPPLPDYMTPG